MDRSAENIKMVYDIFKPAIIEQLSSGYLQDVRPDIEGLMTTYDRIMKTPNHRKVMSNISKRIADWDKEHTDENGINNAMYTDRKSTRLNSSHGYISYAVFCLKKKKKA